MVEKCDNGVMLVTLGEDKLYTGRIQFTPADKPSGIYFSNKKRAKNPNDIIAMRMEGKQGVSVYVGALLKYIEEINSDGNDEFYNNIMKLKKDIIPYLTEDVLE